MKEPGEYAFFTEHTPEEFDLTLKSPDKLEILPTKEKYFDAGHTHDDTVTSVALELPGDLDSKRSTIGSQCCFKLKALIFFE